MNKISKLLNIRMLIPRTFVAEDGLHVNKNPGRHGRMRPQLPAYRSGFYWCHQTWIPRRRESARGLHELVKICICLARSADILVRSDVIHADGAAIRHHAAVRKMLRTRMSALR